MNLTAYDRVQANSNTARNRAERRAEKQNRARVDRGVRRSRVRLERALSSYKKESSS